MTPEEMELNKHFITPEYLSELHSISIQEAELLCEFANQKTIHFKKCYGLGEIIYTEWMKEKKEADKAIKKLFAKNK